MSWERITRPKRRCKRRPRRGTTNRNSTKKAGATISYNGTDFLQLDPCSGLIQQVDMTQDYMNFYHELGATTLHL